MVDGRLAFVVGALLAFGSLSGCEQADRPATSNPVPLSLDAAPPRRHVTPSWSIAVEPVFRMKEHEQGTILFARDRTIWVNSWRTPQGQHRAETLAWLRQQAASDRRDLFEEAETDVTRFAYSLREVQDGEPRLAVYAFAVNDAGYLQMAIYIRGEEHLEWAMQVARSAEPY